jgi:putative oxidoreductase
MIKAEDSPWNYLVMWLRLYFSFHYLKSGLYYVIFDFVPDFSRAGAVGPYLNEMTNIGLYPLVKYLEVILGAMLLFNWMVPLALIVMGGITFQIAYLNLVISPHPRQKFTGTQELLLNGSLLLAYGGYYADYLRAKAKPYFLWEGIRNRPQRTKA